jgi:hypothetical protein
MRRDAVAWERAAEVNAAARGWRQSGAIDDATLRKIEEAFPDPCVTPGAVWRASIGAVVAASVLCTFAAASVALGQGTSRLQVLLLLFAAACLVVTDVLEASPRHARRGGAGVTALLGVVFLLVGAGLVLLETVRLRVDDAIDAVLVAAVVACGLAVWRWGSPVFAGLAGAAFFAFLDRLPHGRMLWLAAGAALTALAARRLDERRLAPSHRTASAVLTVIGIAALYLAADAYSLDERLLEQLARGGASPETLPRGVFLAAVLGTALLPPAVLAWGVKTRRTLLIDTGIVLLALSLATLRHYVHLAPLWVVLSLSGALLVGLALAIERALRQAPAGEVAGFTAEPLFSDQGRQHALQVVLAATTLTAPAAAPAPGIGGAGKGGQFGGGGAQSDF